VLDPELDDEFSFSFLMIQVEVEDKNQIIKSNKFPIIGIVNTKIHLIFFHSNIATLSS
jgi:hypothetical protein